MRARILLCVGILCFSQPSWAEEYEGGINWSNPLTYIGYPFMIAGEMYLVTIWHEGGHWVAHWATGATNPKISVGPGPVDGKVTNDDFDPPSPGITYVRGVAGPLASHLAWELTDTVLDATETNLGLWARMGGTFYLGNRLLMVMQLFFGWMADGDFHSAHVKSNLTSNGGHYGLMALYTALYGLEFYYNRDDIAQNWNRFLGRRPRSGRQSALKFHLLPGMALLSYRF